VVISIINNPSFDEGRGIYFPMSALLHSKRGYSFFTEVSIIVISLKVFTYEVGQALQQSEFELDFFHFSG
jgi:hypothetical protein